MKKVFIINADDFGKNELISNGILSAHIAGVISSTTVMVNSCSDIWFEKLVRSGIPSGIHLNLIEGKPLCSPDKIPSLVDKSGNFHPLPVLLGMCYRKQISSKEVQLEISAQIKKMREHLKPDHFDMHRHCGFFSGFLFNSILEIMADSGIKKCRYPKETRIFHDSHLRGIAKAVLLNICTQKLKKRLRYYGFKTTDCFFGQQFAGFPGFRNFCKINANSFGVTEIMVHPGFCSGENETDAFEKSRAEELETLFRLPELEQKLCSFSDI